MQPRPPLLAKARDDSCIEVVAVACDDSRSAYTDWYDAVGGDVVGSKDSGEIRGLDRISTIEFIVCRGTEGKYFPSAISFSWCDDWNNTPAAVFSFV